MQKIFAFIPLILPGILVAATGVGAGDLATASFAGSHLGVTVLWAVIVGGVFKYILTEGLARWQLVTGSSFLEGLGEHLGWIFYALFLPYLIFWSFFVGSALMSANGVALHALFPVVEDPAQGKVMFGIGASVAGLLMVMLGGFRLFERVMGLCIAVMFAIVLVTAGFLWPGTGAVVSGLLLPSIPGGGQDLT